MKKNNKHKKKQNTPSASVVSKPKRERNINPIRNNYTTIPKPEPTEADKLTSGARPGLIKYGSREYIMGVIGLDGLERIVNKVYTQALKGSFKHQELLMNYLMGKPVERLKLDAYVEKGMTQPVKTVFQIVADTARLEKLSGDVDGGEGVHSSERIAMLEKILNAGSPKIIHLNGELHEEGGDTGTE